MPIDTSIHHWIDRVPNTQWIREGSSLDEIGAEIPEIIVGSRPLAEVHRLDLSLFVIFEEAALRVSGILTRNAPTTHTLAFSAQQTLDEARHYEMFLDRLNDLCRATGFKFQGVDESIMIPPLQRFRDHCYEVADRGNFVEGMALMNLVFEGMAYPLYAYERRYWATVDPYLAQLIRNAYTDETRHVAYGAKLMHDILDHDVDRRNKVRELCRQATVAMTEVFDFYVKKFVRLFDAVAKVHGSAFASAELLPGRKISEIPYAEQVRIIQRSIEDQHGKLLSRAGIA